jgi:hypothetical protein
MEFRLNDLNRMPLTAVQITSQAQEKSLNNKTKFFIVLDVLIILNLVLFVIIAPVSYRIGSGNCKVKYGTDKVCNTCVLTTWATSAMVVAVASLTLDCFMLKQIK